MNDYYIHILSFNMYMYRNFKFNYLMNEFSMTSTEFRICIKSTKFEFVTFTKVL